MERRDLVISGAGSASGGLYNLVKISGTGKVHGDIDCHDMSIHGTVTMEGSVKAKAVHISGKARMTGALKTEHAVIRGSVRIGGDVQCKQFDCHGSANVDGNLSADEVHIHGETVIEGDCDAEQFKAKGGFTIGGLLNAGNIQIKLFGHCQVKEIGGERIEVKQQGVTFLKKLLFHTGLTAESIEGDEIYLEHTSAKAVRGNRVTIGPGCDIEVVEYQSEFQCDPEAKVGTYKKV
ncbi:cytoskeletal protein CcmA (bactofilin family) [Thermolongibacillus altinsuensis]|uniref:Cytoskeletal protein CcmA (Bactofilin family) n=1 Tax=Thermolongibacillus altinsuensis TaxID=575256 RepID=A0A4R1Q5I7_9BACL|nr:polymer-forming cytoskeletal protein [Thermolongibacillus altinsuensis]TCL43125.1 cytoskeletal protein CcmA (bactofilin family) [Thermolongibacillus altinsuensis]